MCINEVKKMIKKSVIAIVAIIAVAGLVFAAYGGSGNGGNDKSTDNSNNLEQQQTNQTDSNGTNTSTKTTEKTKISATKAQEIAQKYIKESGATAGTPKLGKINGNEVYFVPIVKNGQTVGEIDIDAYTGKNMGGAGGP